MIGSLTARIFAIFWLTLALVLMLVLMLPKLDSRQMTELLESEQRQGIMIEQHVEAELANDVAGNIQHIFAVTEQTGESTRTTAQQVRDLAHMAEELRQSVARFKID